MCAAFHLAWPFLAAFSCASGFATAQSAQDHSIPDKRITISVGSAPGGGYDAQARLMSRYLGRHIPGNPAVVVQNVPGAGGLVAANNFYNMAPKDGSAIALLQRTALTAKALVGDNVHFDVTRMNWLGSLASEPGVLVVWRGAPVSSANDLLSKTLIVGGAGAANDSELTPKVINAVIGTHLKIVSGYKSITAVTHAMEQGEVQGVADLSYSNVKRNPNLVSKENGRILMQFALARDPELPGISTPLEFARSDEDRKLLALYFAPKAVARPVSLPPGVAADRVALMRKAFMDMVRDREMLAEAEKLFVPIEAVDHKGVENVIAIINDAPEAAVKRLREIVGGA